MEQMYVISEKTKFGGVELVICQRGGRFFFEVNDKFYLVREIDLIYFAIKDMVVVKRGQM